MKLLTALWIAVSILAAYAITARIDEINQTATMQPVPVPQVASAIGAVPTTYPADPMPLANSGLGCITDSECEGISEEVSTEPRWNPSLTTEDAPTAPRISDTMHLAPTSTDH